MSINVREELKYLFDGMITLDNEYYFRTLSKEEYEKIENDLFTEENNGVVYTMEGRHCSGALQLEMNITNDVDFWYKVAAFPECVVLLINALIDCKERMRMAITIPANTELRGKYVRAHLKRLLWADGYGNELVELYPVLIKADTMEKDGFIPLFDMYEEQSFERLCKFMDVYWRKPYSETVIQELYEKRNPKIFSEYQIVDGMWTKYLERGEELAPNVLEIFRVVFKKYKIKYRKGE